jgi:putative ABC transport system ATP-binding protein
VKKNNLLSLRNVSKIYQLDGISVPALKEVNLEIDKGEFVAIIGPSGSGKSTLMNLMGCLDTPTSGKILLENADVSQLSEEELALIRNRKIGFVFQNFNLLPRTTASANVSLPLFYQGLDLKKREKLATEALEKVGLGQRLNHFPNQLSGGEQQRVAIARALVTKPLVILADEPTGNIDTKSGREIMEIVRNLNRQGNTLVIITHDPQIAKQASRKIFLKDGEVV